MATKNDLPSIQSDFDRNPELKQMIEDSPKDYKNGNFKMTSEMIQSLSLEILKIIKNPRQQSLDTLRRDLCGLNKRLFKYRSKD